MLCLEDIEQCSETLNSVLFGILDVEQCSATLNTVLCLEDIEQCSETQHCVLFGILDVGQVRKQLMSCCVWSVRRWTEYRNMQCYVLFGMPDDGESTEIRLL